MYNESNQLLGYSEAKPWKKGQSGNPGGLSKGSRRKLTDAFIRTLARDWQAHGEEVIKRVREENPLAYFKGMLILLSKDVSLEAVPEQPMHQSLSETVAFVEQVLRENEAEDAALVKNNSETTV